MDAAACEKLAARLLERAGTIHVEDAVIRLVDKPMPWFESLTLCMLSSKPTDAWIAVAAAPELFRAAVVKVSLDDKLRDAVSARG
ncbi:hypothetical protein QGN32_23800 [Mycolicibacterium sp. ND9-15]|uniref:hypothetical protein n=1 Tax=Mycolicibacterium sp. ND9-15 TaxID=3042320 RepID=UPI002DD91CD6|nr:hypothetical protein [Mycolicibacterium sp. ND9-15]WSE56312.1 hypothetical protein QGN32_23800 [Mycolicibacterium sp. ND9-15]